MNVNFTSNLMFWLLPAATRLPRLQVRLSLGVWMPVSRKCFVLTGRGLCVGLITRSEESYRLWCVVVCDLETPWMRRPWSALGRSAKRNAVFEGYSLVTSIFSTPDEWG